jgi:uncharacterized protein
MPEPGAGGHGKRLVGMVHLPALPGAPRAAVPMLEIEARAVSEARLLAEAGFDACIVENFGDAPFHKDRVDPVTVAAMARIVTTLRRELPELPLGVNVLRNDASAAVAIAAACGAEFVRVNVHVGATATDQGVVEGRAAETLRLRQALGARVQVWADVFVKHGRNLVYESIADEARDAAERGGADALIVTGKRTGWMTSIDDLRAVREAVRGVPVLVGSGVSARNVSLFLKEADGVIVGSALELEGQAGNRLDPERVRRFVEAAQQPIS